MRQIKGNADVFYHLTTETSQKVFFYKLNVEGTKHLFESYVDTGIRKSVHYSNLWVVSPRQREVVNEFNICTPANEYEKSKYKGEKIALDFFKKYGMLVIIMHPTVVFDNGERKGSDSFVHS